MRLNQRGARRDLVRICADLAELPHERGSSPLLSLSLLCSDLVGGRGGSSPRSPCRRTRRLPESGLEPKLHSRSSLPCQSPIHATRLAMPPRGSSSIERPGLGFLVASPVSCVRGSGRIFRARVRLLRLRGLTFLQEEQTHSPSGLLALVCRVSHISLPL